MGNYDPLKSSGGNINNELRLAFLKKDVRAFEVGRKNLSSQAVIPAKAGINSQRIMSGKATHIVMEDQVYLTPLIVGLK